MYVNKVQIAGDYVLVSNYTARGFGAPHHKRRQKLKDTPKAMADYNRKMRAEKLQLLIIQNFDCGYHITLDYPKDARPETYEEAEKNLKKFLYAMSRKVKKIKPFKYIAITERGKRREALHHHMIIEGDPFLIREITRLWGNHIKISQMYEDGAYKELAEYFTKIETKEEQIKGRSKYHRSRNLKEPEVKTRIVAGGIPSEPLVPKQYDLIRDSEVSGFNEHIGIRFQKYMVKKGQSHHKSRDKARHRQEVTKRGAQGAQFGNHSKGYSSGGIRCMTTEIFVLGETKNPAIQRTAWARWMIVCVLSNGTVEKRDGVVCINNATTKKAVLTALSQALQRFNKAAVLKIYISDDFVRASLVNGWTNRWRANGWHKIRLNGQLIHEELWRDVVTQLSNHAVSFAKAEELNNKYITELEEKLCQKK